MWKEQHHTSYSPKKVNLQAILGQETQLQRLNLANSYRYLIDALLSNMVAGVLQKLVKEAFWTICLSGPSPINLLVLLSLAAATRGVDQ